MHWQLPPESVQVQSYGEVHVPHSRGCEMVQGENICTLKIYDMLSIYDIAMMIIFVVPACRSIYQVRSPWAHQGGGWYTR